MTFESLSLTPLLIVAGAAFVAAAINAAAGGGSFISFPTLLGVGIPPVSANATNNLAMWLGTLTSANELRGDLDLPRPAFVKIVIVSLIGSVAGALILLRTSNATFAVLIPFLLLGATLLYVFGPQITRAVRDFTFARLDSPIGLGAQFVVAIYGGFFGAAQGILILALLGALGMHDARKANALKNVLTAFINGIACIPYVLARIIDWQVGLAMAIGAIAGGYIGANLVKRLPAPAVRTVVIAIACSMTAYFFWKTYLRG
ncbi:MAG: sulfite exporter TauE/SafE family protein [Vulcanimicrobiaceae bacterium]